MSSAKPLSFFPLKHTSMPTTAATVSWCNLIIRTSKVYLPHKGAKHPHYGCHHDIINPKEEIFISELKSGWTG